MAGPVHDIDDTEDPGNQEPLFTQLQGLSGIYWIANWMELVERFAYYGVRTVVPVFMVLSIKDGGPGFDHVQKGALFGIWALVQSLVPVFSGGFADRYGYKVNIAVATVLKIVGYLLMGYCIYLAEALAGMSLAEARPQGLDHTFAIFFMGAMFLALGTAIFKPGLQGLIAHQLPKKRAAVGWAMFYQMVNVGGFVGPILAGYLRVLEWEYVFLACSAGIALNFIPLFFFAEPDHHGDDNRDGPLMLIYKAFHGLLEPRLFFFTLAFAGFWLMFYQLFDILPNFIDDWVDSRSAASALQSVFGDAVPLVHGGNMTQEWVLALNSLMIMFLAFLVGYVTGKVHSLTAIIVGIAISAVAIYGLGLSMNGWWCLGMIALFSLGEMSASPTKMRYLASIAPPGKEGQYMGYVNFTVGIGWSTGSIVAGHLYQEGGDKIVLARRYLVEKMGMDETVVGDMARGDVLAFFEKSVGVDPWQTRELLWNTYEPYSMWAIFALIGVGSLLAILVYNHVTRRADADPDHSFNVHGRTWVRVFLGVVILAFSYLCYLQIAVYGYTGIKAVPIVILTSIFVVLLVLSFLQDPDKVEPKLPAAQAKVKREKAM